MFFFLSLVGGPPDLIHQIGSLQCHNYLYYLYMTNEIGLSPNQKHNDLIFETKLIKSEYS